MGKWRMVRLRDVATISAGQGAPQGTENYTDSGLPFIKAGSLVDLIAGNEESAIKRINKEIAKTYRLKTFAKDTIIFAKSGMSCMKGYVYQIKNDCYVVNHLACITPNIQYLSSKYLKYWFIKEPPNRLIKDSSYPSISLNDISNIELALPSLPIQQKIADALDKASALIEMRKAQIEKLDLLIKSQFIEMFGDPVTNPRGWEIKLLGDIALVGSSKRVFVEELLEHGIPFYRGTEIGSLAEGKNIVPTLFISPEHYSNLKKATGVPEKGDLLLPSICPDGRIWSVNTSDPFYFKDGRVLWIHFVKKSFDHNYLLYAIKERIISDYSNIASGTTFAELKIFSLKKLRILLPPREKQEQFAEVIRSINGLKQDLEISMKSLEQNYQSLMQKCFSGEMF